MKHRALIIDDERLARTEMRRLLAEFDNVEIIGEAANLSEAVEFIETEAPTIVFLDIQLSNESGFDLLGLVDQNFHLVFVTAFDSFAIRAFEVNALDYLLKPVNPERLKKAIERVGLKDESDRKAARRPFSFEDRIFVDLGERAVFLKISDISHISSAGDYSELFTRGGKKYLTDKSLSEWQERLPEIHFLRIHRQTIINFDEIEEVQGWFNRAFRIRLKTFREPLTVSRRYAALLKNKFV
jgi:two-component system LytT family response regulator